MTVGQLDDFPGSSRRYHGGGPSYFRQKSEWAQLQDMWRWAAPEITIAGICSFVFLLMQVPSLKGVMLRHFVWSMSNFQRKRFHTIFTADFSHADAFHLLFNMASLFALSPTTRKVLKHDYPWVLLGSSVCSNLCFTLRHPQGSCLGLSGFLSTLLAVYAERYPDTVLTIRAGGVFPFRSSARNILYLSVTISALMSFVPNQPIAHSAHLGGLLFGIAYYRWLRKLLR